MGDVGGVVVVTTLWDGLVATVVDPGNDVCPAGNPLFVVVDVVGPVAVVATVGKPAGPTCIPN